VEADAVLDEKMVFLFGAGDFYDVGGGVQIVDVGDAKAD
jgi:hypothetical protein